TGGTNRLLPAEATVIRLDRHHFLARCGHRLVELLLDDDAIGEVTRGKADTAHVQRFSFHRFKTLANNQLGTAAADIDHQASLVAVRQVMGNAKIDQARLLAAGDDLDIMAKDVFGTSQEQRRIARYAQRIGANHAHRTPGDAGNALGKT